MAEQEKNCYLGINGKKYGPVSEADIQKLYDAKKITDDTKFARVGAKEWIPLSQSGVITSSNPIDDLPPLPKEDEVPPLSQESKALLSPQENKKLPRSTFKKIILGASITVASIVGFVLVVGIVIAILDGASASPTSTNNEVVTAGQGNTNPVLDTEMELPVPEGDIGQTDANLITDAEIWLAGDMYIDITNFVLIERNEHTGTGIFEFIVENPHPSTLLFQFDMELFDVDNVMIAGGILIGSQPHRHGVRTRHRSETIEMLNDVTYGRLVLFADSPMLPGQMSSIGSLYVDFLPQGVSFRPLTQTLTPTTNGDSDNAVEAPHSPAETLDAIATEAEIATLLEEIIGIWYVDYFWDTPSHSDWLPSGQSVEFFADGSGNIFVLDDLNNRRRNNVFFTWELGMFLAPANPDGYYEALMLKMTILDHDDEVLEHFPIMEGDTLYFHQHAGPPIVLARNVSGQPSISNNINIPSTTATQSAIDIVGRWRMDFGNTHVIFDFRADGTYTSTGATVLGPSPASTGIWTASGDTVTITRDNDGSTAVLHIIGNELFMGDSRTPYRRIGN